MEGADLVVLNASVLSMDPAGLSEASAVSVRGNRILRVGENQEIKKDVSRKTAVVDAEGGTLLPGFADTHVHVTHYAQYRTWVNCDSAKSVDDVIRLLRTRLAVTAQGNWILGYNYNHRNLKEKRHPLCTELDKVSIDHPAGVVHASAHFWAFNSTAIRMLNIPEGEKSEMLPRDQHGKLTGILAEDAIARFVYPVLDLHRFERLVEGYEAACIDFNRLGVTSVFHSEVETRDEILAWQALREKGRLGLRMNLMITPGLQAKLVETGIRTGFGDEWIRIGPLKLWVDGSVMGGTAALLAPYTNNPSNVGLLRTSPEDIRSLIMKAHKEHYQVTAHAMGDRAITEMVIAIEQAQQAYPRPNARHRIEHGALADTSLLRRLSRLGVMISIQPSIVNESIYGSPEGIIEVIGPARGWQLNDFRAMIDSGIRLSGGSDAPSGCPDPIVGLDCAVNRPFEPNAPEKRITVGEGVAMFTYNAAYASFEESIKGSITPGKLADFVILSKNLMKIPREEILNTRVRMTVLDGKIVYSAN